MKRKLLIFTTLISSIFAMNAQDYCLQFNEENQQRLRYLTESGDYLDEKLNGSADYTIEVWIKPTSEDIHNNVILKRWDQFALTLYQNDNRRFYFTHYSPSDDSVGNTYVNSMYNVINLDEWNHLVVVSNSETNTLKLYANGVEVTADSSGSATTQEALALDGSPADSNLYVGYGGTATYFTGLVDKVRVKNVPESINTLQKSVTDDDYISDENTVINLNFNEGSGLQTKEEAGDLFIPFQCASEDCESDGVWWKNLESTLSVENVEPSKFSIYPNPTVNKYFTIKSRMINKIDAIDIFDMTGKNVFKANYSSKAIIDIEVDVKSLNSGMYILRVQSKNETAINKLIIK